MKKNNGELPTVGKNRKAVKVSKIDQNKKIGILEQKRIEREKRHKEQAQVMNGRMYGDSRISAMFSYVSLISPSGIKTVKYEVSDEEWIKETGFRK